MSDTFPRQYARTRRLTLGEPRNITVSPDDRRVVFLRSRGGSDPINCLWVMDATTGDETLVADPDVLLGTDDENLPAEERARRERAREGAGGVVGYATDAKVTVAAFALSGRLFAAGLISGHAREISVEGPVFDPRPDPLGRRIAYVSGPGLRIAELNGSSRVLAAEDDPEVTWGQADFVAAEEMNRSRGYWWSPDGTAIAACRVDNSSVNRWWISDPAHPERPATEHPYPVAGTANPLVALYVLGIDDDRRAPITWDREQYPYLARVSWDGPEHLLVTVQSRDQRRVSVLRAHAFDGTSAEVWYDADEVWVELYDGGPGRLADGRLVTLADGGGARRLVVGGEPVTSKDLQVRAIAKIGRNDVVVTGNPLDDPTVVHLYRWSDLPASDDPVSDDPASDDPASDHPASDHPASGGSVLAGRLVALTSQDGVHSGSVGGALMVVRSATLTADRPTFRVVDAGGSPTGVEIANHAEVPLVHPNLRIARLGDRRLAVTVLLPTGTGRSDRLPVLLDPYGGPHAQRVVASNAAYLTSQWFADQGFAVVIIDGRGTPGRGSEWERAVHGDLAQPVLDDQVDGLLAAAAKFPQLDLTRVAIRGWSFGGYLAALAVLRRPHVFHAAVAGAPVTDWRLYDTHYTERYLGNPIEDPGPYDRTSLIADAHRLERPLMLIHGLADDNVVAAHTLQFSSALLAAGRPHEVLPLSGVSHMTPQEVVAENLLLLQLAFIRRALGMAV